MKSFIKEFVLNVTITMVVFSIVVFIGGTISYYPKSFLKVFFPPTPKLGVCYEYLLKEANEFEEASTMIAKVDKLGLKRVLYLTYDNDQKEFIYTNNDTYSRFYILYGDSSVLCPESN